MDLLDSIADSLAAEDSSSAPQDEAPSDADYALDMAYQQRIFLLEEALRQAGAIPMAGGERTEMPYDAELKKLIMSVAIE